jgi:hypothetical protein
MTQLISFLKDAIRSSLKEVSKQVADKLTLIVEQDWYAGGADSTLWYERTYQFLNAITKTDVKRNGQFGFQVEVLIDPSLIQSQYNGFTFFNQHMSLDGSTSYEGKSIGEWLIDWIEVGQNSPILSYEGIHMFKQTDDFIQKNIDKMVIGTLKQFGFSVVKA